LFLAPSFDEPEPARKMAFTNPGGILNLDFNLVDSDLTYTTHFP